jgi:hypothetical protein
MVVIMEYDMADNGRYNPDRQKMELIIKREEQGTQHLCKRGAFRLAAETFVTSSTACQGIILNGNERNREAQLY